MSYTEEDMRKALLEFDQEVLGFRVNKDTVRALEGEPYTVIMPDTDMTGDWTRQRCKLYVAKCEIDVGFTVKGEHPNPEKSKDKDVENSCMTVKYAPDGFETVQEATRHYASAFATLMQRVESGLHDRSKEISDPILSIFSGPLSCPFGG